MANENRTNPEFDAQLAREHQPEANEFDLALEANAWEPKVGHVPCNPSQTGQRPAQGQPAGTMEKA